MRKSWPFLVVVGAVSAVAGGAIAGRPTPGDSFVIDRSASIGVPITATAETTTVAVSITPDAGSTTTTPPPVATTVPATTQAPSTTAAATTTSVASTTSAAGAPTSTQVSGSLDRSEVRLVLANGDGRFNLATANANRLVAAGYVQIDETDVSDRVEATIIYFRPGFDDEATRVAEDLGIPAALTRSLPSTPVTINDELGDIIVVLGPDALR
ncbi:MAG: LytR C-terminal domain-containing protein [Actinomycetota bacterium]|nr:MAG: wu:fb09a02 [Acidimicrobiaceae bacterium]